MSKLNDQDLSLEEAKQVKLNVNLAAVEIVYPDAEIAESEEWHKHDDGEEYEVIFSIDGADSFKAFNIFADTAQGAKDALDVAIALGERRGVSIDPFTISFDGLKRKHGGWDFSINGASMSEEDCDTYIDALSAAIIAIGDK